MNACPRCGSTLIAPRGMPHLRVCQGCHRAWLREGARLRPVREAWAAEYERLLHREAGLFEEGGEP